MTAERAVMRIEAALRRQGVTVAAIEMLSPPGAGRRRGRYTFRARAADGALVKARVFESRATAARQVTLRRGLDPAFAPVIGRHGAVVLERWIPGARLSLADAATRAEAIGGLLGRLHVTGLRRGRIATRARRAAAEAALARLTAAGILATAAAATLIGELERCDPGSAPRTIVHRDYCPENFVLDPEGDLHVVDNEWFAIDAPAADLARTYVRWPLAADDWRRVLCGYAAVAGDPGPLRFWILAAAALGTAIRLQGSAAERAVPLGRLCELIDAPELDRAPE
jgi:hypothetical protein